MRNISELVTNYIPPESGFSKGRFKDNPGDQTGSKATAEIVNDLYYAVEAIAYKWIGLLSNVAESEVVSDILTAIEKLASIVGPEDHVESYNYPIKSVIFYNGVQYRAIKNIDYTVDGATFPLQYSNSAWVRIDETVQSGVDANTEAIYNILNPQDISGSEVHVTTRRGPFRGIGVANEPLRKIFYETDSQPDSPYTSEGHGFVELNGKLYKAGGALNVSPFTLYPYLYEFDPIEKTWTQKASMNHARSRFGFVALNNKLLAIGGTDNGTNITVEEWDPISNTWTDKAPLNHGRNSMLALVVSNKAYAIGGNLYAGGETNYNEEYDPIGNTWTDKASLPTARSNLSGFAINNLIYAAGGLVGTVETAVNEEYNPVLNTWSTKASMPTPRYIAYSVAINNKGLVIGGQIYTPATALKIIEEYDPVDDSWSTKDSLPIALSNLNNSAALYRNSIHIHGSSRILFDTTMVNKHFKLIYVFDWLYDYKKINTNYMQVTAYDSYGTWKGNARKLVYDTEIIPVWLSWEYSDRKSQQWFRLPLLNGWTTTDPDGGLWCIVDYTGIVVIAGIYLNSTSASSSIVSLLPDIIKVSRPYSTTSTDSNGASNYVRRAFINPTAKDLRIQDYTVAQTHNFTLVFFNENV